MNNQPDPLPGDWVSHQYDSFMIRKKELGGSLDQSLVTPYYPDQTIPPSAIIGGIGGGTPGGSDTDIQFNDGGVLGGDDNFQWDKNTNRLKFGTDTDIIAADGVSGGSGSGIGIVAGYGADTDADAGDVTVEGGNSGFAQGSLFVVGGAKADGTGGLIKLQAGDGESADDGSGGSIEIISGEGKGAGDGGNISLIGGYGTGAIGGDIIISAGSGAEGGGINISPGASQSSGDAGIISITKYTGDSGKKNSTLLFNNVGTANVYRAWDEKLTTNATPTTISAGDCPTLDTSSSTVFIEARVCARRISGTGGTADDSAGYIRRAVYKRVGSAAPTLVGSIQDDFTVEDQAGWDCTFVVSTNDILLQLTGATNNNIYWTYEITYIKR